MKKKNIRIIVSLALVLGILSVGSTMAILTNSSNTVTNTFEAASIKTQIVEELDTKPVTADTQMLKEVKIKNIDKSNCFIRARITITPSTAGVKLYAGQWSDYKAENKSFDQKGIVYDGSSFATNGLWIYNEEDGFFYFTKPVVKDATTDSLFDAIALSDNADVTIYEEAVFAQPGTFKADTAYSVKEIKAVFAELEAAEDSE